MAYSKPNTFVAGTVLESADIFGNQSELRLYLHEGVNVNDLEASTWIETRHIQPPVYEPYTGTQHGVSGHLAGQQADGVGVRLSFCTSYLTGGGRLGALPDWVRVPNTSFTLDMRRPYKGLFHWWMELEHGPDNVPFVADENYAIVDRLNWIAPYVASPTTGLDFAAAQEGQNQQEDVGGAYWQTSAPYGAFLPFTTGAGYGARSGCVALESNSVGQLTFGLAHYSQIDRVAVVNWGIAAEIWYL